jgi:hypothetical protein
MADSVALAPSRAWNRDDAPQDMLMRKAFRRVISWPVHHVLTAEGFGAAMRAALGWGMYPEQLAAAALHNDLSSGSPTYYTLSGSWHYLEYPDQPQTAGSYLYPPAGSVHTFVCPETNTEDTTLFIRVEGANINFTEDWQFHSILDTMPIGHLAHQLAEERGLGALNYIGAGATGLSQA